MPAAARTFPFPFFRSRSRPLELLSRAPSAEHDHPCAVSCAHAAQKKWTIASSGGAGAYNGYYGAQQPAGGSSMMSPQELDHYLAQTQLATTRATPNAALNANAAPTKSSVNLWLIGALAAGALLAFGGGFYLWRRSSLDATGKKEKKSADDYDAEEDETEAEKELLRRRATRAGRRQAEQQAPPTSKKAAADDARSGTTLTPSTEQSTQRMSVASYMYQVKHFARRAEDNLKFAEEELRAAQPHAGDAKNKQQQQQPQLSAATRESIVRHCARAQTFMQCALVMVKPGNVREYTGTAPEDVFERIKKVHAALSGAP